MPSHLAPRFGVLGAATSIRPAVISAGDGTLANRKRDRPSIGRHDRYPRSTQGHTVHPGLHSYGRGKYRTVSRNYRGLAGFLLGKLQWGSSLLWKLESLSDFRKSCRPTPSASCTAKQLFP